ncbi:MAG: LPS export ABC transporter periplasmic protein LptC [Armatimonadota bacterium]
MISRLRPHRNALLAIVFVGIGCAVAFLAVSWWQYLHQRPQTSNAAGVVPSAPAGPARPREEVLIKRPSLKHTEGGRLAWQVRLKELRVAAGGQAVAAAGMREALIYDKTGVPVIRLAAQRARGNTSDRNLEVSGDVRAVSQKGALINTEQIRWLEQERRLYCPGKVTMRSANAAVTTTGLSYFVDADIVRCPNPVRLYSGANKLIGRELVYNIKTQAFEMKNVQAVFNPDTVRRGTPGPAGARP